MSISRNPDGVVFGCDTCGDEADTGETEFNEALRSVKGVGWKCSKVEDGEWEHTCPHCQEVEKDREIEDDYG